MDDAADSLVALIVQGNYDSYTHISNQLLVAQRAEYTALFEGVSTALDASVWGGTTAQYESTLNRIQNALHPSQEMMDRHRAEAEKWVKGES